MINKTLVKIDNISFGYNHELALRNVNLEIYQGDFLGIIGPNGGGKTTLLKIILGLLKPKTGGVKLFNAKLTAFRDWHKIGYVPQKISSLETRFPITVEEVVSLGRVNRSKLFYNFSQKDDKAVQKALAVVQMEYHANSLITKLSGGEQQRAFIAKALASEPELLILDEPTVGVDVETQEKFYTLLKKLNTEFNLTLILVSHDIDVIANEVKTIACLNHTLIYHGTPEVFIKEDYLGKVYGNNVRFILHGH